MPPVCRPDDSSGRAFRKALRAVEQREPLRPFKHADILWEADKLVGGTGDAQAYRAVVGDHMLFVIEMSDAFLADQPAQFPRVSWSVITGEGWEDTLVGGAAPDIPVAKARAEALWRALLGQKQA